LSAKNSAVLGTTERMMRPLSFAIEKKPTYERAGVVRAAAADSYAQSQMDPIEKYA